MDDLVAIEGIEKLEVKRRLRDLKESWSDKRHKLPESISEAVGTIL